jgi:hypothetical protein
MNEQNSAKAWFDPFTHSDRARYYFVQTIQGINITFPVDFAKESGVWKISEF